MSRTKAVLEEVSFKNDIGQTINPGDKVVIVTTGYSHKVSTNLATYRGLVNGRASCVKDVREPYNVLKSTGERIPYSWFNQIYNEQRAFVAAKQETNKNYDPEYGEILMKWSLIETKHEIVPRKTTLQLNRAYKLAD